MEDHRAKARAASAAKRRAVFHARRIARQSPTILATNPERVITLDDYMIVPFSDEGDKWLLLALEYQSAMADRLIIELRRDLPYRRKIYQQLTELIARHERI